MGPVEDGQDIEALTAIPLDGDKLFAPGHFRDQRAAQVFTEFESMVLLRSMMFDHYLQHRG